MTFSGKLYFRRSYFFTLFQSNNFATTVIFSEQLYLQSICFFWPAPFSEQLSLLRSSYCFRIGTFLEQNFYRAATTWEKEVLWGSYFSEQLPFLAEELFRMEISTEELLLFRSMYFCTASAFSEELHFGGKKQFFRKAIFRITHFFGELRFYSSYFFKRRYLL